MKIFNKKELTEEEIQKKEAKVAKIKETAATVGKVAVGALAFVGGALLVLLALGLSTESDQSSDSNQETSTDSANVEDSSTSEVSFEETV